MPRRLTACLAAAAVLLALALAGPALGAPLPQAADAAPPAAQEDGAPAPGEADAREARGDAAAEAADEPAGEAADGDDAEDHEAHDHDMHDHDMHDHDMHDHDAMHAHAGHDPDAAGEEEGEILYWYDPMVPGSHFDAPGKSPFMDMDLVPMYASSPNIVTLSEAESELLALVTEEVAEEPLDRAIHTSGEVTYDERNVHAVTVRVNAQVARYFPFHVGLMVKKGQPLYELQGPEIYTYLKDYVRLQENVDRISAVSTDQTHIAQQAVTTLRWRGIPQETIDSVVEKSKPTDRFIVRAPISGMILERGPVAGSIINAGIKTGQFVTYGEPVAKVVDLSFVYVEARLWGEQMDYVTPGMIAEVRPHADFGRSFEAEVTYVYPVLETDHRFGIARIAIDNPDNLLKPGMFADVVLRPAQTQERGLAVPRNAVTQLESGAYVFVQTDATHYERRAVEVGMPLGDRVPVLSGLEAGERVVTSGGSFFLFADTVQRAQ